MSHTVFVGQVPYETAEMQLLGNRQQLEALGFTCGWTEALAPGQLYDSDQARAAGYQVTDNQVVTSCYSPGMRFDIHIDPRSQEVAVYGEPHVSAAHYPILNRYITQMREWLGVSL